MSWNFRKNKAVLMISHDIWTAPVITSWNFGKKKNFCWYHLKIWTAPIITSWQFHKNKAAFFKWF